jgi:hypothetical protein
VPPVMLKPPETQAALVTVLLLRRDPARRAKVLITVYLRDECTRHRAHSKPKTTKEPGEKPKGAATEKALADTVRFASELAGETGQLSAWVTELKGENEDLRNYADLQVNDLNDAHNLITHLVVACAGRFADAAGLLLATGAGEGASGSPPVALIAASIVAASAGSPSS